MSNEEIIEPQTKPKIEPKISDEELLDLESPRSEAMTELKEMVSNKFKVPTTIQEFYNILDKNGLETLEDWKEVTKEQKNLFPVGLSNFLDKKADIEPEEGKFYCSFLNFSSFKEKKKRRNKSGRVQKKKNRKKDNI